jgi:hypothetical protein
MGAATVAPVIIIVTLPAAVAIGVSEVIVKETVKLVFQEIVRPVAHAIVLWIIDLWRKIRGPIPRPAVAGV